MKAITLKDLDQKLSKGDPLYKEKQKKRSLIDSFSTLANNIIPGELVVVASRPTVGKTTFLFNVLVNQVVTKNEMVLLLSAKDKPETNLLKLTNLFETNDSKMLESVLMNPQPIKNPFQAKDFIKQTLKEHDVKAIYIDDYWSLTWLSELFYDEDLSFEFEGSLPQDNALNILFSYLVYVANEYNIPLIVTEEMSRAVAYRGGDKRPMLTDIKYEKLEQLADKILLLYRAEYYRITEDEDGNSTKGVMEVMIQKNKNGDAHKTIKLQIDSNLAYK